MPSAQPAPATPSSSPVAISHFIYNSDVAYVGRDSDAQFKMDLFAKGRVTIRPIEGNTSPVSLLVERQGETISFKFLQAKKEVASKTAALSDLTRILANNDKEVASKTVALSDLTRILANNDDEANIRNFGKLLDPEIQLNKEASFNLLVLMAFRLSPQNQVAPR